MPFTVIPGGKTQQGNAIPIESRLSSDQIESFRSVFGTLQEEVPNFSEVPVSFCLGELLWFCARGTKSQFFYFENILTGMEHALQSVNYLGLRILFENIIFRLKDSRDTLPQPMSPENQVVYDFVIDRISQTKEVQKRIQSGILHLISNHL